MLFHFSIWNSVFYLQSKIKLKRNLLPDIVNFILSIILVSIIGGYYIGVINWGSPINYELAVGTFSEWSSFASLLVDHIYIVSAICLGFSFLFLSYSLRGVKSNYNTKHIVYAVIALLSIISIITISNGEWFEKQNSLKNEIFHSFFMPNKPFQRIEKFDIGLSNLNQEIEIIDDFDKKNVLFFSIDCLRADHLSFNNYSRQTSPFLDSLYRAGRVKKFDLSTSTCSSSFCGILSMLNSKNLQNLTYYKYGIHDYLKDQGYRINFILSGFHENWYDIKNHYGKNIDHYVEGKYKTEFNTNDDALILDEVKSLSEYQGEPNFFFFHFMGPHNLGFKAERYEKFKPIVGTGIIKKLRFGNTGNKDLQKLYLNNYDNGVFQSDAYIHEILNVMEQKGYMENALVVIAGDHGESLGNNHEYLGHGNGLSGSFMNIPILFIDDDVDFYNEDRYASQVDIAPTIADRLGLPIPKSWQGVSLKNKLDARFTYHEQTPQGYEQSHVAVIHKTPTSIQKYIVDQNTGTESLLQINQESNNEDTVQLSSQLGEFYRQKIKEYTKHKFKVVPAELESFSDSIDSAEDYDLVSRSSIMERCDFLELDDIKNIFGADESAIKTVSLNRRRAACSCYFLWTDTKNKNHHITVDVDASRSLRRNLTLIKNKLNYVKIKHQKLPYLFKSVEDNSVAFIDKTQCLYIIKESEHGSIQTIEQSIKYAEMIYDGQQF